MDHEEALLGLAEEAEIMEGEEDAHSIMELTEDRLRKRQRQVDIGKMTAGYKNYCERVHRDERNPHLLQHPLTPEKTSAISKRSWSG